MTTVALATPARRHPVLVLAVIEGRRLVTHPATIAGWLMLAVMFTVYSTQQSDPVYAFDLITTGTTFYPGLFCVLAGHMVTTRDSRAGTAELLAATPVPAQQRVAALLAAASVPALVALGVNLLFLQILLWQGGLVEVPGTAHVLQGPVTVLGGTLLGIMLGLWLPHVTTPVLAMVVLVAGCIVLGNDTDANLFSPMVSWADWGPYDGKRWYALVDGSPGSHVAYLLGLCGLAATAALLRSGRGRRGLLALGVLLAVVVVVAGRAQLP
jgi:hypothetical protein